MRSGSARVGSQCYLAPGEVLRIHPALAQTSRQAIVEVAMEPVPDGARAGQFVRATLSTAAVDRLLVPFRAVRQDREKELLWALNEERKVERRAVRTGLRIANRIEIREGLEPGDRVVTRGFLALAEGKRVQVVEKGDLAPHPCAPTSPAGPSATLSGS